MAPAFSTQLAGIPPDSTTAFGGPALGSAVESALRRIPPLWPLRHFVAVNPFLGLSDLPFEQACCLLQRVVGSAPLQNPGEYRRAYETGMISDRDLDDASDGAWNPNGRLKALEAEAPAQPLPTVADWLDREQPGAQWGEFVVDEISKWCAATFDQNQTTWNSPWRTRGLYAGWREAAEYDLNPEARGLAGFRAAVGTLPADAAAAIAHCLEIIRPPPSEIADFLHRQLTTVAGWAGYAQYLAHQAALQGKAHPALTDLLAIRLAYDAALHRAFAADGFLPAGWSKRPDSKRAIATLAKWQSAYEAGYQRQLAEALAKGHPAASAERPRAQAIFCIDVRSEGLRRGLEEALPGVQTIGFAGFFGFAVSYRTAGDPQVQARCPALLAPNVAAAEACDPATAAAAAAARAEARAWKGFQNSAASCFSFVEAFGLFFGAALAGGGKRKPSVTTSAAPEILWASLETRVKLAATTLRNLGLTSNFAPLVLLCGHGGESANNPYRSAFDCGACGGHAGDINARLAAATLNDPAVRIGLGQQGLVIPSDTVFLAGLHNTTTDEVVLLDVDQVPKSHSANVANLQRALSVAAAATRQERAPLPGRAGQTNEPHSSAAKRRAIDPAQLRPEWGLANNAALIAAPRNRTAALKLGGRVFLHDYVSSTDAGGEVLGLILSGPVVVASWINLQYYASRVDPERYGAGSKLLHNVLGGIGVVEGNGGDLKVGLPLQSIHDGENFVHEPRRLSVYIEASPAQISGVLEKQPPVKQLFDHGWIHLFALQGTGCLRYRNGRWLQWVGLDFENDRAVDPPAARGKAAVNSAPSAC